MAQSRHQNLYLTGPQDWTRDFDALRASSRVTASVDERGRCSTHMRPREAEPYPRQLFYHDGIGSSPQTVTSVLGKRRAVRATPTKFPRGARVGLRRTLSVRRVQCFASAALCLRTTPQPRWRLRCYRDRRGHKAAPPAGRLNRRDRCDARSVRRRRFRRELEAVNRTADIANSRKIHAVWHRGKKAAGPIETFTP